MPDTIDVHSLEYPITEHCNLRCANCDHASPILNERFAALERFSSDLKAVAPFMRADDLRILGGEPLLHPQLLDFLRIARTVGISNTITLVTNGVLLHQAPPELWSLIDRLWVSVYPKVTLRLDLESIRVLCKQHGVLPDIRMIESFHQTIVNHKNGNPALVQRVYDRCKLAHEWMCYTLYDGYFYKCAPAPFLAKRLARRGLSPGPASDGVKLTFDPELREQLRAYLSCEQPLEACSYCLGSSGAELSHHQLNGAGLMKILSADDPPYPELILLTTR